MFVLVEGTFVNLEQMSEAARVPGINTLLVMGGSGGLSDWLYRSWYENKEHPTKLCYYDDLICKGGFESANLVQVNALLLPILQSKDIMLHNLDDCIDALKQKWASVFCLANQVMVNAVVMRNLYRSLTKYRHI